MLADSVHDYFVLPKDKTADSLAYMLFTPGPKEGVTDKIPAVIHADNTARVQTISKEQNPKFVQLLEAFKERSGVPILINTSFNTKGEPMVETPQEAIETFLETSIDYLTLGNTLIKKHG
jgi:carbamoyltransferase